MTTATRHIPILFSADMIRAILQGRKTQTRRLIKPQPYQKDGWWKYDGPRPKAKKATGAFSSTVDPGKWNFVITPYGHPGARLWVRETWAKQLDGKFIYRADKQGWELADYTPTGNWRPSIHMPRAASRITLDVRSIQVQRLHDISPADAIAEGIDSLRPVPGDGPPETLYRDYLADEKAKTGQPVRKYPFTSPIESYRTLWQKINGPQSWDLNPWVWVIQFNRLNT